MKKPTQMISRLFLHTNCTKQSLFIKENLISASERPFCRGKTQEVGVRYMEGIKN
jgi:hypothetical protein